MADGRTTGYDDAAAAAEAQKSLIYTGIIHIFHAKIILFSVPEDAVLWRCQM